MKIAFIAIDAREPAKKYDRETPYFGTAPQALLEGFAQLGGGQVEVHIISCLQQPAPAPEKIADNIYYHQLVVPKGNWMRTLYSGCVKAVRAKLDEIQPDLIHAQGTERESAICAARARQRCPKLLTIHGNMRSIAKFYGARILSIYWLAAKLERFVIPRVSGIVCVSSHTQRLVESLARATYLIPNAVDSTFFDIERDQSPQPQVLCVGTVDQNKNQIFLIEALAPLAAETGLKLSFFGNISLSGEYGEEFSKRLELNPWCEHHGQTGRDELKQAFARAAAIILPSHEDNCPMVILEAMAARVPIIASRVGGIPDLIEEGVTGLFCDPGDGASMRDAVRSLIEDPELVLAITAAAHERASANYRPAQIARRHLELYRELI